MNNFEYQGHAAVTRGVKPFPRQSAWAVLGKQIGVIHEYPQINKAGGESAVDTIDPGAAEVHFVNAKGETTEVVRNVPIGALSIAKLNQIPAARRPSAAQAKRFGYQ